MFSIPSTKPELRALKPSKEKFAQLKRNPIFIVLDNLKYGYNIGTILRLGDALLVEKVFICGSSPLPPDSKIKSGSRGAEKWVPWEHKPSAAEILLGLRGQGIWIVAVELTGDSIFYDALKYNFPLCLVFGREDEGVSADTLSLSDAVVELPVYGMANSINVASSASVVLYEATRQLRRAA